MTLAYRFIILLILSCLAVGGCSDSSREQATGKANIRGVNAIVGAPNVNFLIEERSLSAVAFKASSDGQRFDDLSFNFNFDLQVPGATDPQRLVSELVDVTRDHDYLFILTGTINSPSLILRDTEERQWDGSETVFELTFDHVSQDLGPVDVYFSAPATDPVPGNALGTLAYGERIDAQEFTAGDYEIILTPSGDPLTILYRSGKREFAGASTAAIMIFDTDPATTGDVNVRLIGASGAASEFADPRFPPLVHFLHAEQGAGNIDIAEEEEFSPPLVQNLAFGERTAETPVTTGTQTYNYTAAGNMGAAILENEQANASGQRYTRILVGPTDDPDVISTLRARRPFTTSPRLGVTDAASNFDALDFYLLPAGESVEDNNPTSRLQFKLATGMSPLVADNYEITVTPDGEKTIVAGPEPLNLAVGDVVDVVIIDTADPNLAELLIYSQAP